ncbi:MAG: DUF3524 domain-containing protein [Lentisphaerae bacterium]|nr:DUF3524 domain-containing protein [Lentisphaerota bacterium]
MKILALEPYYGGSHRAFLDGWTERSRHEWTVFDLPATKWKWRMRHAPVTLSARVEEAAGRGQSWDLVFCSDMLDLAGFRGLATARVGDLPCIAYFHENQLTYPVLREKEWDYHFVFSNMTTALAADSVWFNSAFHRDSFLDALESFLRRMPDQRPLHAVDAIRAKSVVRFPGIEIPPQGKERRDGPLRILWAARWEHDKDPDTFFRAMELLTAEGVDFRLSVIGGGDAREVLPVFDQARKTFADRIDHWGYMKSRAEYVSVLDGTDVIVSTARHEFFGITVVEAVAAGSFPLVPERLAYPEVLGGGEEGRAAPFFYSGDARDLARRLERLAERLHDGDLWEGDPERGRKVVAAYAWDRIVPRWDDELESLVGLQGDDTRSR